MTDTPTPAMTPEQRAELVTHYTRGKWYIWNGGADCPVPLGTRLEIAGGFDDTWTTVAEEGSIFWPNVAAFRINPPTSNLTAERDDARDGEKTARNLMQKAFDVNRKVVAERDAAQAELSSKEDIIARLTAALATPDQIAALAAERATTVTVKPLVWAKHPSADIWRCDTMIGTYKVFGGMPSWDFDSATDAKDKTSNTSTSAKLAQAAAQADYDARIRSAITITSGASPDTIAKSDDFVSLPLEDVKALMETITIQCGLLTMGCGGAQHRIDIVAARIIKALTALQERMK